jgi:hypothetical protein
MLATPSVSQATLAPCSLATLYTPYHEVGWSGASAGRTSSSYIAAGP